MAWVGSEASASGLVNAGERGLAAAPHQQDKGRSWSLATPAPRWPPSGRRRTGFASGSRSRRWPPRAWPRSAPSPTSAARAIREKGAPRLADIGPADLERIDAIERETRHDVIAFLTWLAEAIGPDSRFVHQGMTSRDVLDTCLSVQLTQATDLLLADLDAVLAALKAPRLRAQAHADHRPQPRHPRRADQLRPQARRPLCRVRPQPRPAGRRAGRDRRCADQRRGRHVCPCRPARGGISSPSSSASRVGAGLDPGDPARPPRRLFLRPRGDRQRHRAAGDRGAPPAAQRSAGGGGVLPSRPEGQLGDAAQAQSGAVART